MKTLRFFAVIFVLFSLQMFCIANANDEKKWKGFVEFIGKPGTDRSLAKGDMFIPFYQNHELLLFGNIRAVFDDHDNSEGNFGVGVRRLLDNWIVGGYGYFDVKETENDNTFTQGTVGFELLSEVWDFRVNGYFPEGGTKDVDDLNEIEINGNQIGARLGEERALSGADIEVGYKLPVLEDTRLFLGGFYYDESDFEEVSGPKARLEVRLHDLSFMQSLSKGSRLTFGVEYTDDDVRGSQTFGLLQLRIPFGKTSSKSPILPALERRMVEAVVRDDDVIVTQKQSDELLPVINPATGAVITTVNTIDANTTNVPAAVTAAGQNSLIVADGSQGVIDVGNATVNTLPGQFIAGGGSTINLNAGGETIPFTPAGSRPTFNRAGNGDLLFVDNDNNVSINAVELQGGRPLRIRNSTNVTVSDITVVSTAGNRQGVLVQTNSDVAFSNLNINSAGREGLLINGGSTASLVNTNIQNTGREGVEIVNGTVQLNNVNISDTNFEGIRARNNSSLIADNVFITRTNREAIEVNNSTLTLTNSIIQDINVSGGDDGISAVNNSTLTVDNVRIDNVTSQGILVNSGTTATIRNSTLSNTTNEGIFANNSTLDVDNTTITNTGLEGIQISNTAAQVDNVLISNAGTQGLRVSGTANAIISDFTINTSGAQGAIFQNSSTSTLTNVEIMNTGNNGIQHQNNATFTGNNILISNTANDGVRASGGSFTLNNSTVNNIGNGGGNDDAFHLTNTTLDGTGNSIQGTINNGLACRTNAGNTGSIGFSSGPITSCP